MFKREEVQLNHLKQEYENTPVSLDSLDKAIITGFNRAKAEEKKLYRKKNGFSSLLVVALLIIGLFSTIRVSPAFASYISSIPGMEKIVEMIRDDKGRVAAVEHQYYQDIGVYDKNDSLQVTIDGAISDEMGIVLFYTLESDKKIKEIMMDEVEIKAHNGTPLDGKTISYGQPYHSDDRKNSFNGTIEFFFQAPLTTKEYVVDIKVKGKQFSLPFTLNDYKAKKEYPVHQTLELESEKINVEKVTIYPLRAVVHLEMDPNNKKQILQLDDLRLVDENNEVWGKILNGITKSGDIDSEQEIYLQSNYFKEPKELYLVLNKAQAIEKDETTIIVDTEKLEILKQPVGSNLDNVRKEHGELSFDLHTEKEFNYFIFSEVIDAQGNEISKTSMSAYYDYDNGVNRIGMKLPVLKPAQNPITIELAFYPQWIKGEDKIKVK
ncbi:DUF4179 domain-containing protein [Sutcliffiella rhizosphaerae]|uniref:DUF4179 domain-containing protein n=1 Tax=Sutcliffiella rhizosphaerae TaxID=2880967 RepID=A0ABM8YPK1_9BACI|nr:DUF4179 domain-containing protein [Sutcliffiella rhizosphaerae]CAG9621919.1 hypothetical protein BACCIP111883_02710 [Sutcliffiella rhizosphaerae]